MSLLIANTSIAAAGGGKGSDYIGQVSKSASDSFPIPTAKELEKLGLSPDASNALQNGGTATAIASLAWNNVRMDGVATSSISSNTVGFYTVCAKVNKLIKNGVDQGGTANQCKASITGGAPPVTATKSVTVVNVHGINWRVDTAHQFYNSTGYNWNPTLSVSATP